MNCIKCNGTTSVLDSRRQETSAIKRRRKCGTCGHRFNTIEQVLTERIKIIRPKVKPRDTFDDPFDDPNYLESLSDHELEELIGG